MFSIGKYDILLTVYYFFKQMKDTILFDLDRTLFDTAKMISLQRNELTSILGIEAEEIDRIDEKYKNSDRDHSWFNLDDYTYFVGDEIGISGELINTLFWDKNIFKESIYKETPKVIKELDTRGYCLGIYSEGQRKHQRLKYNSMKLHKYFNRKYVFITEDKRANKYVKKLPKNAYVVDDNPDVLNILNTKREDLKLIWLNRKNQSKIELFTTVFSIPELLDIFN